VYTVVTVLFAYITAVRSISTDIRTWAVVGYDQRNPVILSALAEMPTRILVFLLFLPSLLHPCSCVTSDQIDQFQCHLVQNTWIGMSK
jgi:hypothetical protein